MTAAARHRTITLTGAPPVRVDEAAWPVVAEAVLGDAQAKIRRHADGRALSYGVRRGRRPIRAGRLVEAGGDLAAAARLVAEALGAPALADALLARLPPVAI